MNDQSALRLALELVHSPWQARRARTGPLPADIQTLLRIAAGEEQTIMRAAKTAGRSNDSIIEAATFFIEQVLLDPEADSYRVLGVAPNAKKVELRRNMALLLRWLHPDLDPRGERSIFAGRVTNAWNNLKTSERRDSYEKLRNNASTKKPLSGERARNARVMSKKQARHRPMPARGRQAKHYPSHQPISISAAAGGGLLRRVLLFLFGGAAH
jgi:hypothetical protein